MAPKSPALSQDYDPVSPIDMTTGPKRPRGVGFVDDRDEKKETKPGPRSLRTDSTSSMTPSVAAARKARFAEATAVLSPASGPGEHQSPFADPPLQMAGDHGPKPSDVGFGYISDHQPVEQHAIMKNDLYGPGGAPLKSALKTPGTASRFLDMRSPTFREEQVLEKHELQTEEQQAKDVKIKTRVRIAKMLLRGVNFSCSLIVLAMLSTVLTIFHATKSLPPRNSLPPWAPAQQTWPQIVVLVMACVSLLFSIVVMLAYCRGGHKRAQKVGVYYTMFAVGWFIFSVVMWLIGAGILQGSKANGAGQDLWGWSCNDNKRRQLFQDDIHYALVCRLQDWSLVCCIIEVVIESIVIAIYGIIFYRFYSKHRLRKSMDARDRARSDLYLAQLRTQSAPNTPGFAQTPRTPHFPTAMKVDTFPPVEEESPIQYAAVSPKSYQTQSPFKLQAPPIKIHHATPRPASDGFEPALPASSPPPPSISPPPMSPPPQERVNEHVAAAPGEQTYDAVPIPGAYMRPTTSQLPGQAL